MLQVIALDALHLRPAAQDERHSLVQLARHELRYPDAPGGVQPSCETAGVLSSITAAIGALQVAGALRLLATGSLEPGLTTLDVWNGSMRQIPLPPRDPECPACGRGEFPFLDGERRAPSRRLGCPLLVSQ